jgi:hypothetical protein
MTEQYVDPFFGVTIAAGDQHVVVYPAQIWPVSCAGSSLRDCLTFDASVNQGIEDLAQAIALYPQDTKYILGYSQSTQIQTLTKRQMMLDAQMAGGEFEDYPDVKLSMVANIDKPNGGILERFSWAWPTPTTLRPLGITAYGPTPTNTPADPLNPAEHAIDTVNISFVYDGMGDFPANPFNPLAVANAVLGMASTAAFQQLATMRFTASAGQGYAGTPRPVVIVHDDRFDATDSITFCPLTTSVADIPPLRIPLQPNTTNGLTAPCTYGVSR